MKFDGYKSWIELSKSALRHNFQILQKTARPAALLPIIKANAYGHGADQVARILSPQTNAYGVDSLDEAEALKRTGVRQKILILGYIPNVRLKDAIRQGFEFVLYDLDAVRVISGLRTVRPAYVHIKIDTGLSRQGVSMKDLPFFLRALSSCKNIKIAGLATHFANIEDTSDRSFADNQRLVFDRSLALVLAAGFRPPSIHAACSAALILYPETRYTLARSGIALYGLWPSDETRRQVKNIKLKPVLTWKTRVALARFIEKGANVGYGLSWTAKRTTRVALLPIGYADGFDRGWSNGGFVLIHGIRCPMIGRVCMNMCMADATRVDAVKREDEAVLIGRQGREEITADEMAKKLDTINYEIVARLSPLLPRMIVE